MQLHGLEICFFTNPITALCHIRMTLIPGGLILTFFGHIDQTAQQYRKHGR